MSITKDHMFIRAISTQKIVSISRKDIRRAINYTFHVRTIWRKELSQFSNYNSALFGLLSLVFQDISYKYRSPRGNLRLVLKGIRFFFSGMAKSPSDRKLVINNGATGICLSFYHLRDINPNSWVPDIIASGCKVLLDSGAYSLYKASEKLKNKEEIQKKELEQLSLFLDADCDKESGSTMIKPITLEEYSEFVITYLKMGVIHHYVNLDVFGDSEQTKYNQQQLERLVGVRPVPVHHWDSPISDLDDLVQEDHPFIALGGTVKLHGEENKRAFFQRIFSRYPGVCFHWLGGSSKLLFEFPFFSSDSTSHLIPRMMNDGTIITPNGFNNKREWSSVECIAYNVKVLSALEESYDGVFQLEIPVSFPKVIVEPTAQMDFDF